MSPSIKRFPFMLGDEYESMYNGTDVWIMSFFANKELIQEVKTFLEDNQLVLSLVVFGPYQNGISFTLSPLANKEEVKERIFAILRAGDTESLENLLSEVNLEEVKNVGEPEDIEEPD